MGGPLSGRWILVFHVVGRATLRFRRGETQKALDPKNGRSHRQQTSRFRDDRSVIISLVWFAMESKRVREKGDENIAVLIKRHLRDLLPRKTRRHALVVKTIPIEPA